MSALIIEPHYLGSLEYFVLLSQYDQILIEVHDSFRKQTYRNRTYFLTSNKVQPLVIPVSYSSKSFTKDVKIDYSQRWIKDHWGTFYSAYGKAPFFDHFSEKFREIWKKKINYLVDLNLELIKMIFDLLQIQSKIKLTTNYKCSYEKDFRDIINPKQAFCDRRIYDPAIYMQLFGKTFVPNLSIVDLIMCEGSNTTQILTSSTWE